MCGVHPKVQKYADQIISEGESNSKITTDFEGYELVITDYKIPFDKKLNEFNEDVDKTALKVAEAIKKRNRNDYYGTLIVPENTKIGGVHPLLFQLFSNMLLRGVNEKSDICGCYHYNFLKLYGKRINTEIDDMPKLKIISFFKK